MDKMENLDRFTIILYEKLKDQRKITPILMQKYAKVDIDTSKRMCERVWRLLWEDARRISKEVVLR
jgi:uncharacterized protein YutE (UPF0331/DUF86 family)